MSSIMGFADIFNLLEIAILPETPQDYESGKRN
jgi:hypothetical protein